MRLYLPLLIVMFCTLACKNDSEQKVNQDITPQASIAMAQPWSFTIDSLVEKGGGPCKSTNDCMNIRVVWPVIQGGDSKVRKVLNDSIQQFIIRHLEFGPYNPISSIEAAVKQLLVSYESYYKENSAEYTSGWGVDIEGRVNLGEKYACVEINNYSFMGGAHPNYYTQYSNFDLDSGKLLKYADFVKDTSAFKAIAEQVFISVAETKTGEKANMQDFFWSEGFQLAENFKLGKDTLELLYNPYEAAAYVYGEFEIKLPLSELTGIIDFQD